MAVLAVTFGIIFLAEVADTSGLVTLVLATRYRASLVLLGVCAAFLVQVGVAITVGSLVARLPERPLEFALAVVFLVGAVLLLRVGIGAVLALWSVSALAVYGGSRLLRVVPVRWVTRATAAILVVLAALTAIDAIRG
jgi:Ca2+/H+ antiporter, TMEM165/GDT1 family